MSFFSRNKAAATPAETAVETTPVVGKGAPTPKQRDKAPQRGPVAPPPMTQREAIKRSKVQTKPMTKDERKAAGAVRREQMMRGDDNAVLPRDRGPVRRYVRNLVDSRRNLAGLILPVAVLSFVSLLVQNAQIAILLPAVLMIFLIAAIIDGVISGRQINRKVRAKFPNGDPTKLSMKSFQIGYYAFQRAMLPRRWRAPRATYKPGDAVD